MLAQTLPPDLVQCAHLNRLVVPPLPLLPVFVAAATLSTSDRAHIWEHLRTKVTDAEYQVLVEEGGFKAGERAPSFWPDGFPFQSSSLKLKMDGGMRVWQAIFHTCAELKLKLEMEVGLKEGVGGGAWWS